MNRSTRTLIVVAIAVALAGLASFGVYRAVQNLPVQRVEVPSRFMVVASQPVTVGMLLTREMVKTVGWPAGATVPNSFETPEEVIGRGVTSSLALNEIITENKLAPKGTGGGLAPTITAGMRAITVKVNDVTSVAGFAVQGTRVDVIVTVRNDRDSISRTVLSNVQVLAAGPNIDTQQAREGASAVPPTVTLLLTPPDAEKLALATTQGQVTLALRNPLDMAPTETRGVGMAGLMGSVAPPPVTTVASGQRRVLPPPPPPPPPAPYTIETIRGTERKQEVVKGGRSGAGVSGSDDK